MDRYVVVNSIFRILGAQLLPDEERGYKIISSESSSQPSPINYGLIEITDQDFNTAQDIQG